MIKHNFTIRQLIVGFICIFIIVPSFLIIYTSIKNNEKTVQELNAIRLKDEAFHFKTSLDDYLSKCITTNNKIGESIILGITSLKDNENFKNNLLIYLNNNSNIMSIEYADESNESMGVARDIFGQALGVGIAGKRTKNTYSLYAVDEKMKLKEVVWKQENYDARTTPWYTIAKKEGKAVWTSIYLWPNGDFGIDYVSPIIIDKKFVGVVDVSIKLPYLQSFITSAKSYPNSQIFLLEDNGAIIAGTDVETSLPNSKGEKSRVLASESKNKVLKDVAAQLISKYSKLSSINNQNSQSALSVLLNNKPYSLTVSQYENTPGIKWVLAMATLNSDLQLGIINYLTNQYILIIALLVICIFSFSLFISIYITTPLSKLVRAAGELSQGNFDTQFGSYRNDEFGMLAESFIIMKNHLKSQMNSLKFETTLFSSAYFQLQVSLKNLKENEQKYRVLFNSGSDAIFVHSINKNGTVSACIDVNDTACVRYGYTKEEFSRMTPADLDSPDTYTTQSIPAIKKLLKRGRVLFETLHITKKGKVIPVEINASIFEMNGARIILSVVRDITERKKIENEIIEMKNRNESILRSIGDGVFATDINGVVVMFNAIAEKISGISAQEAIGKKYTNTLSFINEVDYKLSHDNIIDAMKNNRIIEMTNYTLLLRKDGKTIPILNSIAPIKDSNGTIMGCVVVFHDVTNERRIDKAKTEFVSLASHQLRTPLSTINWYTEMLLSNKIGTLNLKQNQYTQEVYSASRRMVKLVNSILNVSRLELGTFIVEPNTISIIELAQSCVRELALQSKEKNISISQVYDNSISPLPIDSKLMSIVIQNILLNSIKYTKKGGNIKLKISKEINTILISISDTGIGIPSDQQKNIFEKLFRADNAKVVDADGSGLGLYLAKEIVNHSGGDVSFTSEENKGTTFFVRIPLTGMKKKSGNKHISS